MYFFNENTPTFAKLLEHELVNHEPTYVTFEEGMYDPAVVELRPEVWIAIGVTMNIIILVIAIIYCTKKTKAAKSPGHIEFGNESVDH